MRVIATSNAQFVYGRDHLRYDVILIVQPLVNFFRGAFDGSGADNFYDAGSCIDGRLTSAWNCK